MAYNDSDFGKEFDIDYESTTPSESKVAKVVKLPFRLGKSALTGFMSGITGELAKEYQPLQDITDELIATVDDFKSLKDDLSKELTPAMTSLRLSAAKLLPRVQNFIPRSIYKKLDSTANEIIKEAESNSYVSDETRAAQANEYTTSQSLNKIFALQQKQDRAKHDEEVVNRQQDRMMQSMRFKQSMNVAVASNSNLIQISTFLNTTFTEYLKKDLELKFHNLFVTKDIYRVLKTAAVTADERLKVIAQNSGLPDSVKANDPRWAKKKSDNSWRSFVGSFFQKMRDNAKSKIMEMASNIPMVGEMISSFAEMQSMEGGALGWGDLAKAAVKGGTAWYGKKKVRELLKKHPEAARIFGKQLENLPEQTVMALMQFAEKNRGEGDWKALLAELMPQRNLNKTITNSMLENPKEATSFDNMTRQTIVEIIPAHLAHIGQFTEGLFRALAPNAKEPELKVFNLKQRKLTDTKTASRDLVSHFSMSAEDIADMNENDVTNLKAAVLSAKGADVNSEAGKKYAKEIEDIKPDLISFFTNCALFSKQIDVDEFRNFISTGSMTDYIAKVTQGINDPIQFITQLLGLLSAGDQIDPQILNTLNTDIRARFDKLVVVDKMNDIINDAGQSNVMTASNMIKDGKIDTSGVRDAYAMSYKSDANGKLYRDGKEVTGEEAERYQSNSTYKLKNKIQEIADQRNDLQKVIERAKTEEGEDSYRYKLLTSGIPAFTALGAAMESETISHMVNLANKGINKVAEFGGKLKNKITGMFKEAGEESFLGKAKDVFTKAPEGTYFIKTIEKLYPNKFKIHAYNDLGAKLVLDWTTEFDYPSGITPGNDALVKYLRTLKKDKKIRYSANVAIPLDKDGNSNFNLITFVDLSEVSNREIEDAYGNTVSGKVKPSDKAVVDIDKTKKYAPIPVYLKHILEAIYYTSGRADLLRKMYKKHGSEFGTIGTGPEVSTTRKTGTYSSDYTVEDSSKVTVNKASWSSIKDASINASNAYDAKAGATRLAQIVYNEFKNDAVSAWKRFGQFFSNIEQTETIQGVEAALSNGGKKVVEEVKKAVKDPKRFRKQAKQRLKRMAKKAANKAKAVANKVTSDHNAPKTSEADTKAETTNTEAGTNTASTVAQEAAETKTKKPNWFKRAATKIKQWWNEDEGTDTKQQSDDTSKTSEADTKAETTKVKIQNIGSGTVENAFHGDFVSFANQHLSLMAKLIAATRKIRGGGSLLGGLGGGLLSGTGHLLGGLARGSGSVMRGILSGGGHLLGGLLSHGGGILGLPGNIIKGLGYGALGIGNAIKGIGYASKGLYDGVGHIIGGGLRGIGGTISGVGNLLGGLLGGGSGLLGAGGSLFNGTANLFNRFAHRYVDIYRVDKVEPGACLLTAKQQEEGVYFADGSKVKASQDITAPVFAKSEGNEPPKTLISNEDLRAGLCDAKGRPLKRGKTSEGGSFFNKIGQGLRGSLAGGLLGLLGLGLGAGKKIFEGLWGAGKKVVKVTSTLLGRMLGIDTEGTQKYQDHVMKRLDDIHKVIMDSHYLGITKQDMIDKENAEKNDSRSEQDARNKFLKQKKYSKDKNTAFQKNNENNNNGGGNTFIPIVGGGKGLLGTLVTAATAAAAFMFGAAQNSSGGDMKQWLKSQWDKLFKKNEPEEQSNKNKNKMPPNRNRNKGQQNKIPEIVNNRTGKVSIEQTARAELVRQAATPVEKNYQEIKRAKAAQKVNNANIEDFYKQIKNENKSQNKLLKKAGLDPKSIDTTKPGPWRKQLTKEQAQTIVNSNKTIKNTQKAINAAEKTANNINKTIAKLVQESEQLSNSGKTKQSILKGLLSIFGKIRTNLKHADENVSIQCAKLISKCVDIVDKICSGNSIISRIVNYLRNTINKGYTAGKKYGGVLMFIMSVISSCINFYMGYIAPRGKRKAAIINFFTNRFGKPINIIRQPDVACSKEENFKGIPNEQYSLKNEDSSLISGLLSGIFSAIGWVFDTLYPITTRVSVVNLIGVLMLKAGMFGTLTDSEKAEVDKIQWFDWEGIKRHFSVQDTSSVWEWTKLAGRVIAYVCSWVIDVGGAVMTGDLHGVKLAITKSISFQLIELFVTAPFFAGMLAKIYTECNGEQWYAKMSSVQSQQRDIDNIAKNRISSGEIDKNTEQELRSNFGDIGMIGAGSVFVNNALNNANPEGMSTPGLNLLSNKYSNEIYDADSTRRENMLLAYEIAAKYIKPGKSLPDIQSKILNLKIKKPLTPNAMLAFLKNEYPDALDYNSAYSEYTNVEKQKANVRAAEEEFYKNSQNVQKAVPTNLPSLQNNKNSSNTVTNTSVTTRDDFGKFIMQQSDIAKNFNKTLMDYIETNNMNANQSSNAICDKLDNLCNVMVANIAAIQQADAQKTKQIANMFGANFDAVLRIINQAVPQQQPTESPSVYNVGRA